MFDFEIISTSIKMINAKTLVYYDFKLTIKVPSTKIDNFNLLIVMNLRNLTLMSIGEFILQKLSKNLLAWFS